jgi:hypothetical protein
MELKLIMALVAVEIIDTVLEAAQDAGATGSTVITSGRGEGLEPVKKFLGLEVASQRDIMLFVLAAPKGRDILETIATAGCFENEPSSGIAFQISIEDADGLGSQAETILQEIEVSI